MRQSLRAVWTIFKKEALDLVENINVSAMLALPVIFCLVFKLGIRIMDDFTILLVGMITTMALVPVTILSMTISEEKEKNTLRTLMLSGVTGGQFLWGKALAVGLWILVLNTVCFFIAGMPAATLPLFLAATLAAGLSMLFFGALVGILCRDQMSASTIGVPLQLILMISGMMSNLGGVFAAAAKFNPVYTGFVAYLKLAHPAAGSLPLSLGWCVGVMLAWTALTLGAFLLAYRKKGVDH